MSLSKSTSTSSSLTLLKKAALGIIAGVSLMVTTAELLGQEIDPQMADVAYGNDNPTLAFGLMPANYWSPGFQYIDLTDSSFWTATIDGEWGALKRGGLIREGHMTSEGEILSIPEDGKIGMHWKGLEGRQGTYVFTYEGEGDFSFSGDVRIISQEPGRIVLENIEGGNIQFWVEATDPQGIGEVVKNIALVREEHEELHQLGATFNPEWLELISDARQIRFMDWMSTNGSKVVAWDENVRAQLEDMVKLANEIGADPWFNIPHMADDEYILKFAEYVRDNLDPSLQVRVEYSNEVWNYAFEQTQWLMEQAREQWGGEKNIYLKTLNYHVKMAVNTAQIWEDVFSGQAEDRLINVIGSQGGPISIGKIMESEIWRHWEPENYVSPASIFEEVAVTTYFGTSTVSKENLRSELIEMIKDPSVDATAWYAEKLMDPNYSESVPKKLARLREAAEVAEASGLELVGYEGGQHVHHSFAVYGLTDADISILTEFMSDFVRSPEMAELYQELWNGWAEIADNPFMQFGDILTPSKTGSWGLYETLDDTSPRAELLEELNASTDPWWDAVGGSQYQQGAIVVGSDEGELHVGSSKTDYLVGKGGNDIFVLGLGDDGAHGGAGYDAVVMRGSYADYEISREGDTILITGPEGTDTLIEVEEIRFSSGEVLNLATMAVSYQDGLVLPDVETPETPTPDTDQTDTEEPTSNSDQTDAHDSSSPEEAPGTPPVPPTQVSEQSTDTPQDTPIEPQDNVSFASSQGVSVSAINAFSSLGSELGLTAEDPAYLVVEKGVTVELGGQSYAATYYTTQEARAGKDGPVLSSSAIELAQQFGSIVNDEGTFIEGSAYKDRFQGRDAADYFDGAAGNDYMIGGGGDDVLLGGAGNDKLFGNEGDDTLSGGTGNDLIDGGEGTDTLRLTGSLSDYWVSQSENGDLILYGLEDTDTLRNIELVEFESGSIVSIDAFALEEDLLANVEQVVELLPSQGSLFDAALTWNVSFEGADTGLVFSSINRFTALGKEIHLGNDRGYVVYDNSTQKQVDGKTVGSNYWTTQEGKQSKDGEMLLDSALDLALELGTVVKDAKHALIGTDFDDAFYGRRADDIFHGGEGNDVLSGSGGNDTLSGGAGNDKLVGGSGIDTAFFSGTADGYALSASKGKLYIDGQDGQDLLDGIEKLLFESGEEFDVADLAPANSNDWSLELADYTPAQIVDTGHLLFG